VSAASEQAAARPGRREKSRHLPRLTSGRRSPAAPQGAAPTHAERRRHDGATEMPVPCCADGHIKRPELAPDGSFRGCHQRRPHPAISVCPPLRLRGSSASPLGGWAPKAGKGALNGLSVPVLTTPSRTSSLRMSALGQGQQSLPVAIFLGDMLVPRESEFRSVCGPSNFCAGFIRGAG
jgi:hypothetical protein